MSDTSFESIQQWYDADTATIAGPPAFDGAIPGQFDPEQMITAMIDVLTGKTNAYRTLVPAEAAEEIKKGQAAEWDLTV